jgi:hypothetical protein
LSVLFVALHKLVDFIDLILYELLVLFVHNLDHFISARRIDFFFIFGWRVPICNGAPVENEVIL